MAIFFYKDKDPDAVLDYQWDWSAWLSDDDSITSYTVTVDDGLTLDTDTNTSTAVTAWFSGGTIGERYDATAHIITADGREDDRTMRITVTER